MKDIKQRIESVVKEAGKFVLNASIDKSSIKKKGHANFVTEVDYMVQEFFEKELQNIIPGSNLITEESQHNEYNFNKPTWILDPVDGTTNLMYDYHHSAISLALFIEGKPALGIIYNPTGNEIFIGEHGKGASLNGKEIRTSENSILEDCLIAFGTTPYNRSKADKTFELVKNVFLRCRDIRRSGSAALDMAYVACGRLDAYFEAGVQPWDVAAGFIILEEAGGRATAWNQERLNLLGPTNIVATNGTIHNSMIELLLE